MEKSKGADARGRSPERPNGARKRTEQEGDNGGEGDEGAGRAFIADKKLQEAEDCYKISKQKTGEYMVDDMGQGRVQELDAQAQSAVQSGGGGGDAAISPGAGVRAGAPPRQQDRPKARENAENEGGGVVSLPKRQETGGQAYVPASPANMETVEYANVHGNFMYVNKNDNTNKNTNMEVTGAPTCATYDVRAREGGESPQELQPRQEERKLQPQVGAGPNQAAEAARARAPAPADPPGPREVQQQREGGGGAQLLGEQKEEQARGEDMRGQAGRGPADLGVAAARTAVPVPGPAARPDAAPGTCQDPEGQRHEQARRKLGEHKGGGSHGEEACVQGDDNREDQAHLVRATQQGAATSDPATNGYGPGGKAGQGTWEGTMGEWEPIPGCSDGQGQDQGKGGGQQHTGQSPPASPKGSGSPHHMASDGQAAGTSWGPGEGGLVGQPNGPLQGQGAPSAWAAGQDGEPTVGGWDRETKLGETSAWAGGYQAELLLLD